MDKYKISIDVTQIDKTRLRAGKPRADGSVPKYLDLVVLPRREIGKFGDTHIIKQDISKQERESNARPELPIIGNAKPFGSGQAAKPQEAPMRTEAEIMRTTPDDEQVPF